MSDIDWNAQVASALAHLDKPGRRLSPAQMKDIIDDVIAGKLSAGEMAAKHGNRSFVATALGHVTTGIQGTGAVKPMKIGGWYKPGALADETYIVAPGFAKAWKAARGLR